MAEIWFKDYDIPAILSALQVMDPGLVNFTLDRSSGMIETFKTDTANLEPAVRLQIFQFVAEFTITRDGSTNELRGGGEIAEAP